MNVSGRPSSPSRITITVAAGRGVAGTVRPSPWSADGDEDLSIFDLDGIARDRGVPLWKVWSAGPSVETPEVPWTDHHAVLEPSLRERSALVRAPVSEGMQRSVEVDDHDLDAVDHELTHLTGLDSPDRPDGLESLFGTHRRGTPSARRRLWRTIDLITGEVYVRLSVHAGSLTSPGRTAIIDRLPMQARRTSMIYELRIYEVVPGRLPDLNRRFETITTKIWDRLGIKQAGFWTADVGTSNELIYLLAWESLAEREQKWNTFQADPEWIEKRAQTEANGPIVARVRNSFLRPTSYSSVQ